MYAVLVVGLVAVIVVIVVYVVLSVRLGRTEDDDEVAEELPRGREQRGLDSQRWADDRPRRVTAAAGRSAPGRRGEGPGYRERPPERDGARSRGAYGRGDDTGPAGGRRPAAGRERSEGRPQAGAPARRPGAERYDPPRSARPAPEEYPSGDLGPLEFPTGDYPSVEFSAGDYASGGFSRPDFPSGEFPSSESAEFAAVRAEESSDYPSEEFSLAQSSSRPADRAGPPARRGAGDSRRADARQRDPGKRKSSRGKRDDDGDWGSTDWDKLSDEQYWAELSADKPLSATTRTTEAAGRPGADRPDRPGPDRGDRSGAGRTGRSGGGRTDPGRPEPGRGGDRSDPGVSARDAAKAKTAREPARPPVTHSSSRPAGAGREEQARDDAGQAAWSAEHTGRAGQDLPTQRLPMRDKQQRRERPGADGDGSGPARDAGEGLRSPGAPGPDDRSVAMLASLGGPAGKPADLVDDDPLTSPSFSRKAIPVLDSRSYGNAKQTGLTGPMPAIPSTGPGPGGTSQPGGAYAPYLEAGAGSAGRNSSDHGLPGYPSSPYSPPPADYAAPGYGAPAPAYQAAPAEQGYYPPAGPPVPEYGYPGGPPAPAVPSTGAGWYAAPAESPPPLAGPYAGYADPPSPPYAPEPAPAYTPGALPRVPEAGGNPGLYGYGYAEPAPGYQAMPPSAAGEHSASAPFPSGHGQVDSLAHLPDQGAWSPGYGDDPAGGPVQGGYPDPYAPDGYSSYHAQG